MLIPRPESEFVVVEFLALTKELESVRAVDVGTGSGCLALASAHHKPGARFVAIDASEAALAVAARTPIVTASPTASSSASATGSSPSSARSRST